MYWKAGFVILFLLGIGYVAASDFTCGGLKSTDKNVCSKRGICVVQDVCLCDNNRGGLLCDQRIHELDDVTKLNISDSYMDHSVLVDIDSYGIPHFDVKCDKDEFFALGYYRASNRLWQYIWYRLLVNGQASSIFGQQLFTTDVLFRTYNFVKSAKEYYLSGNADPAVIEDLQHFTAGINAYISKTPASQYSPSLQFILRGQKPALFQPHDIFAMERLALLSLDGTDNNKITRLMALKRGLSLDRVLQLYPQPYRSGETTIFDQVDLPAQYSPEVINNSAAYIPPRLLMQTRSLRSRIQGPMMDITKDSRLRKLMNFNEGASNIFLVGKKFTEDKESILANDPHVSITAPAFWDVYHVTNKRRKTDKIGFAVAFSPYLFGGKNKDISFGFVAAYVDNSEVFRMVDGPTGGYMHDGQELQYEIRMENIQILMTNATTGLPYYVTQTLPVYDTIYGPLGNTLYGVPFTDKLALKTSIAGTQPGSSYLDGLKYVQDASNMNEFIDGAQRINTFGLTLAYADKKGNICAAIAAGIPNRKLGHTGMFVVPGDGTHDWTLLPNDQKPFVCNPKKGFLSANNNRQLPEGHPLQRLLGYEFGSSYRGQRSTNLMSHRLASGKINPEFMRQVQMDTHSLLFDDYKPLFVSLLSDPIVEQQYLASVVALATFDGTYKQGHVAPALFEIVKTMSQGITAPEGGSNSIVPWVPSMLMKNNDPICKLSAPFLGCKEYLYRLIKDATNLLLKNYGQLPRWGVDGLVGKMVAKNTPLSSIPAYEEDSTIITGPTGGSWTLNVAQPQVDDTASLHSEVGPSIRILSLGKENSLFVSFPGGNSEFPNSPYYRNFASFYQNGTYAVLSMNNYQTIESVKLL